MLALRQGAARLAPRPAQALRTTRRYASGGAHHAQEGVNEPLGVSTTGHDGRERPETTFLTIGLL